MKFKACLRYIHYKSSNIWGSCQLRRLHVGHTNMFQTKLQVSHQTPLAPSLKCLAMVPGHKETRFSRLHNAKCMSSQTLARLTWILLLTPQLPLQPLSFLLHLHARFSFSHFLPAHSCFASSFPALQQFQQI